MRADQDLQVDRSTAAEQYYDLLLESCERLFDNEVEPHAFEDQMRYMFGTKVCPFSNPRDVRPLTQYIERLQDIHSRQIDRRAHQTSESRIGIQLEGFSF